MVTVKGVPNQKPTTVPTIFTATPSLGPAPNAPMEALPPSGGFRPKWDKVSSRCEIWRFCPAFGNLASILSHSGREPRDETSGLTPMEALPLSPTVWRVRVGMGQGQLQMWNLAVLSRFWRLVKNHALAAEYWIGRSTSDISSTSRPTAHTRYGITAHPD